MSTPTNIFASREALMEGAAELLILAAQTSLAARDRWMLVLAGGSTPADVYRTIAKPNRRDQIDWQRTWVFWGDERCVPPDDPQSNYRMARETLLDHVPIPTEQVIRMQGELQPDLAAEMYSQQLQQIFELQPGELPVFDTVLLGMGADGHTASLFPGTTLLKERKKLVISGWVEQQQQERISLTLPVMNAAHGVLFLISGADKAAMVKRVVQQRSTNYPATLVQPTVPALWLLDGEAAHSLD